MEKSSIFPNKLEVEYTFFGPNASNSIIFRDGKLIFTCHGDRKEKIFKIKPTEQEWNNFWNKIDSFDIWKWKKRYENTTPGLCVDGDIWSVKIIHDKKKLDSFGWAKGPGSLETFFNALRSLTKLDIREPFVLKNK